MSETTPAPAASGSDNKTTASNAGSLESQLAAVSAERDTYKNQLADANTRGTSAGINIARERFAKQLRNDLGIEPVMSADGEIDLKATYAKAASGKTNTSGDDLSKAEKEALQKRIDALENENKQAKAAQFESGVTSELSRAFGDKNVLDLNDTISLFKSTYRVVRDDQSGELRVMRGTEMMMNAENKPATVEEVAVKFLDAKKYLVNPTARAGNRDKAKGTGEQVKRVGNALMPTKEQLAAMANGALKLNDK